MNHLRNYNISIRRGDTLKLRFNTFSDGDPYFLIDGEQYYFTVKKSATEETILIQKILSNNGYDYIDLILDSADTATMQFDTYVYDLRRMLPNGNIGTPVYQSKFVVTEVVGTIGTVTRRTVSKNVTPPKTRKILNLKTNVEFEVEDLSDVVDIEVSTPNNRIVENIVSTETDVILSTKTNTSYQFDILSNLTLSFPTVNTRQYNEIIIDFISGGIPTVLTLPLTQIVIEKNFSIIANSVYRLTFVYVRGKWDMVYFAKEVTG